MTIPLDRILTVSARDYVDSQGMGIELCSYEMVGVHARGESFTAFAANVPDKAEVVVDFRSRIDSNTEMYFSGTALIRRK